MKILSIFSFLNPFRKIPIEEAKRKLNKRLCKNYPDLISGIGIKEVDGVRTIKLYLLRELTPAEITKKIIPATFKGFSVTTHLTGMIVAL